MNYYKFFRPLFFKLDPEKCHNLVIFALKNSLLKASKADLSQMQTNVMGLKFISPIGLAAGFDKNADCIKALFKQKFGFIETGTVTPIAQEGNPKPRLFRFDDQQSIVNQMGFNNKGVDYFHNNLKKRQEYKRKKSFAKNYIIGANIGKNKDSASDIDDYNQKKYKKYLYKD